MKEARVRPGGRIGWVREATPNDSDKTFTVPAGKMWELLGIYVEMNTSGTAGNRVLSVALGDGTNVVDWLWATAVQIANSTTYYHFSYNGGPYYPGITNYQQCQNGPRAFLPPGYTVRVYDISAIDAAADDMTVVLHYIEYDA